jgi:dihydroflavonol-4-reductase
MRVAVTGAAGHLGANLVRALIGDGHQVRVLVHESVRSLEGLDVEAVRGDVLDPESLRALCAGVELVYHLAAVISIDGDRDGSVERVNVEGTKNVVQAALGACVRRLVHTSSIHAFDLTPRGMPVDETWPRSDTPRHLAYDRSKAAGEQAVRHALGHGLDAVIVNPTGVLGPHDHGPSLMGRFFLALYRRELLALVDGGFDWVDARDVARGMLAAAEVGKTGTSYILSGHWCSMAELGRLAYAITKVPPPRWTVPLSVAAMAAPIAGAWARLMRQDALFTAESLHALRAEPRIVSDQARRELGYTTRPLSETIECVHEWLLGRT